MSKILEKFINKLEHKKTKLPSDISVNDITSISFQPMSFTSELYVVNVWFSHEDIPNQTTFKYKALSLEKCKLLQNELAKATIHNEDDLFTEDSIEEDIDSLSDKPTQKNSSDSFFNKPNT